MSDSPFLPYLMDTLIVKRLTQSADNTCSFIGRLLLHHVRGLDPSNKKNNTSSILPEIKRYYTLAIDEVVVSLDSSPEIKGEDCWHQLRDLLSKKAQHDRPTPVSLGLRAIGIRPLVVQAALEPAALDSAYDLSEAKNCLLQGADEPGFQTSLQVGASTYLIKIILL